MTLLERLQEKSDELERLVENFETEKSNIDREIYYQRHPELRPSHNDFKPDAETMLKNYGL